MFQSFLSNQLEKFQTIINRYNFKGCYQTIYKIYNILKWVRGLLSPCKGVVKYVLKI